MNEKIFDYKDEIIADLQEALAGTIKTSGRMYYGTNRWEINDSDILTKLIQEAGRWCENYASDLFVMWKYRIDNMLEDGTMKSKTEVFAFRESGIDPIEWYEKNKEMPNYYRAVWFLDINIEDRIIEMVLHK